MIMEKIYNIALIDDDPMMVLMFKELIKSTENIKAETFLTGEEFFEYNRRGEIDLVVTDYHLDSVNKDAITGRKIIAKLNDLLPDVPVIVVSSQNDVELAIKLLDFKVVDYIEKTDDYLLRVIESIKNVVAFQHLQEEMSGTSVVIQKDKNHAAKFVTTLEILGLVLWLGSQILSV